MAQNSTFVDEINLEATKVQAHLQKSFPGIGISLKTTQTFIWELYSVVLKPICEEFIFPLSKFFVRFVMLLTAHAPFDLIIAHYLQKQGWVFQG